MTTTPRLIVIGDSFSVEPMESTDHTVTWPRQVAADLGLKFMPLSQHGVSQDWCFQQLRTGFHAKDRITAEDRIIICLTHSNRYWFVQDEPNLSNMHIIGMDQYVSKEKNKAIQGFMQHIQRPQLDTLHMIMRLGWLTSYITRLGLPKPLILRCFDIDVSEAQHHQEIAWATGTLFDIQTQEFAETGTQSDQYFRGIDCRYNHITLSNHHILAKKIVDFFQQGLTVDLAEGFAQGLILRDSWRDTDFCAREFNQYRITDMHARPVWSMSRIMKRPNW